MKHYNVFLLTLYRIVVSDHIVYVRQRVIRTTLYEGVSTFYFEVKTSDAPRLSYSKTVNLFLLWVSPSWFSSREQPGGVGQSPAHIWS